MVWTVYIVIFRFYQNTISTFKTNRVGFRENQLQSDWKASLYCLLPKYSRWNQSASTARFISVKGVIGIWPCVKERHFEGLCISRPYFHIWEQRSRIFLASEFLSESPTIGELDPPYNSPFQERVANQRIAFPCPAKGGCHCYHLSWQKSIFLLTVENY